jgi:ribosomal protein S18 acetylase RimI-like enzyme
VKALAKVDVRKLTIQDYDAIIRVWELAGLPYKPEGRDSRENTAKQMELFPEFYIGAFYGNELVGVVIASYDSRMKGWINRLAVNPAYQRQGVAKQLVKKAEESLKKCGAKIFCALIELPNDKSVGLFQKMKYALHRDILYATKRESEDV